MPKPVPAQPLNIVVLSKRMPTGWEMMGSIWQNAECETLVWQTIRASSKNYESGEGMYSLLDLADDHAGVRNSKGYERLKREGYFIESVVKTKKVVIPTQKLVDVVRGHLSSKNK
jgi:hypothetical protein